MKKPKHTDFNTEQGMHSAMTAYARSLDKPRASVTVTYADGTEFTDTFECATKEVRYKVGCPGEVEEYCVDVDTCKFIGDYLWDYLEEIFLIETGKPVAFTYSQLKARFKYWITDNVEEPVSIVWTKECVR